MTHIDPHEQMEMQMHGAIVDIDINDVARQQTWGAVLTFCASKSGLQDKAVAAEIGMQDAVWSRCKTGQNAPNGEQLIRLMRRCGNNAPLYWLLLQLGYDPSSLRRIETDVERENRELRERLTAVEREREIEKRTVREILGRQ